MTDPITVPVVPECQGADFSRVFATLNEGVEAHISRDNLSPIKAAIFRDRGGHALGELCPSAKTREPIHAMTCELMHEGEECTCRT